MKAELRKAVEELLSTLYDEDDRQCPICLEHPGENNLHGELTTGEPCTIPALEAAIKTVIEEDEESRG